MMSAEPFKVMVIGEVAPARDALIASLRKTIRQAQTVGFSDQPICILYHASHLSAAQTAVMFDSCC